MKLETAKKNNQQQKPLMEKTMKAAIFIFIAAIAVTVGFYTYESHYVLNILYFTLIVGLVAGLIGCYLLRALLRSNKIVSKILWGLIQTPFFLAALLMFVQIPGMIDDKKAFDSNSLPTVSGKAKKAEFSSEEDDGELYMDYIYIKGQEYDTTELVIEKIFYEKELKGKNITVTYLPNSKYAVSVYADGWDE
ncbi:hypothetical protein ACFFJY_01780 [Fictibacillus aquaticus]|uniref:Uncharacterized protein n=1 Tax=Fictibacillus aquaticus TaxID=2021314 RepID=A0A235F874_9BACL|nr:hypothetical protein [Fictibacillus aquaticus]OYD57442.1 hypothetical protein CGZ90_12250 [Fictibacillus aquaticus]